MTIEIPQSFWLYFTFFVLLLVDGLWCMLATRNLVRILIGLEILMKSVTFFLIAAGYLSGRMALAQALVITVIVIEVVVVVVVAGIILGFYRKHDSLDVGNTRRMKG
ncbi:MAG: NADH-quinone oxidoreductase subunit K [Candidatus Bipolaricaulota bacterium]|nr:NADH-quinone oxidoreductase subunit K [Candidatus Bipolaricaulota bacterium]